MVIMILPWYLWFYQGTCDFHHGDYDVYHSSCDFYYGANDVYQGDYDVHHSTCDFTVVPVMYTRVTMM